MKLRKIELIGFKSFRSKTCVEIGDGITAIVGPNGCGKSNIVDAIRWALGTQSIRSLRGGQMTDVIFAGSGSRKKSGLAEVSLTFENEDGDWFRDTDLVLSPLRSLIAASPVLTVSRRIFRAGDNHYLVNNNAVRLKDIQEIFLGTGAGDKGYSIIEQGQIEFLVGARPAERRRFVEELAGVSRYRFNRQETERKLASTQQNLDRLEDLLSEVKRQISQLKRQSRVAERHACLSQRKRQIRLYLLLSERRHALAQADELGHQLNQVRFIQNEKKNKLALLQSEETQLSGALNECETNAGQLTEELYHHRAKGSLLRQAVEHANSEAKALSAERFRLGEDLQDLLREVERQQTRLDEFCLTLAAQPVLEPAEEEELENRIVEASAIVNSAERHMERLDRDLRKVSSQLAEERAVVKNRTEELTRLTVQRSSRLQREGKLRRAIEEAETNQAEQQRRHKAMLAEEFQLLERQSAASEQVGHLRSLIERLEGDLQSIKREWTHCEARRSAKQEAADQEVSEGARQVMQAARQGHLAGVVGILGEGIIAPSSHEHAVHGILRDLLEAVVVKDAPSAQKVVRFAEQQGLVVTCVEQRQVGDLSTVSSRSLLAAVELADWIPGHIRRILAGACHVGDLSELPEDESYNSWVDSQGNCVASEGFWRSGDPSGGAMARRARLLRELAERQAELEAIKDRWADGSGKLESARSHCRSAVQSEQAALAQIQRHRKALIESEALQSRYTMQIETLGAQLADLERVFQSEDERLEELQTLISAGKSQAEALVDQLTQLEEAHDQARQRRDDARLALAKRHKALSDHQALRRQLEAQRKALAEERDRLEAQIQRNQDRIERQQKRLEEIEKRSTQLGQESQVNQDKVSQADERVVLIQTDLDHVRERLDGFRQQLRQKSIAVRSIVDQCSDLSSEIERLKIRHEKVQQDLERIHTTLAQQFVLTLEQAETALAQFDPPQDPPAVLAQLDNSLDNLGPVNHMAAQELREAEERHRFLAEQQADLLRAVDDLRATIDELDRASRAEFMATFEALRLQFEQLFVRLFRGGEATLALTDEGDPLQAGVEVFVRPPGKRVRCMSLLSGGEKALTAVAFVFAAFQLKPSPFCVLDEVDAPLDDANVDRFIELITELASDTQFLVITHNRLTMEAADALIGVTMQDPGCSKLVGVSMTRRRGRRMIRVQRETGRELQLTG